MVRAYVRDALPRSGPYRYASEDDYSWVETKDCFPTLNGMLEMAQANNDPGRSPEDSMRYAALATQTSSWSAAQMQEIAQRWPQNKELAWMAAAQCNAILHCLQAAETAQRMATMNPDNVLAWLPLLQFAFFSAQSELFHVALEGADAAQNDRSYTQPVLDSMRTALTPLRPPAACALEFERRSLGQGVHYDTDTWKAAIALTPRSIWSPIISCSGCNGACQANCRSRAAPIKTVAAMWCGDWRRRR